MHFLIRWASAALVLGALGGVLWRFLARPGVVTVTPDGAVTTEAETLHQFGNVVVYLVIGAVICFVWAGTLAVVGERRGWILVPFVISCATAAALLARAVGLALSPDKVVIPRSADAGDTIPGILTMDAWSAVVAWAVFGVAGLLFATWLRASAGATGQPAGRR